MPRDLGDVLHYFLPELDEGAEDGSEVDIAPGTREAPAEPPREPAPDVASEPPPEVTPEPAPASTRPASHAALHPSRPSTRRSTHHPALPVLGVPIGDRDVVRAAFTWNLAVETARAGGSALIVVPDGDTTTPLWPGAHLAPMGCEVLSSPAKDLAGLYGSAAEVASQRGATARRGGIVFVRIPPAWLGDRAASTDLVRWFLLLSSSKPREIDETARLLRTIAESHPRSDLGVSIHGVSTIAEARGAYEELARRARNEVHTSLISYGLLVDDLHVYRAIAAQRPIGLAHPQAPATRALMDVSRLLYEDARSRVLG